jgi:hypothetical protein
MSYEGRLRLPLSVEALAGHLPTLETWLRLNPQWSVLALKPAADAASFELRLRLDQDERESTCRARVVPLAGGGWRLRLEQGEAVRAIDMELSGSGQASELALRDSHGADSDGAERTYLALWLRATADYILLSAGRGWRPRVAKWFLDRIWLRMNLTGRRVVILILAYEVVGLAFLIGWLLWERIAG